MNTATSRNVRVGFSVLAFAITQLLSSAAAQAQESRTPAAYTARGDRIEEVVVTAQRREQILQEVPIAVTAVQASDLEAAGIDGTLDYQQMVPSLRVTPSATWAIPRIRGIGNTAAGPGQENAVATYVDGVYVASSSEAMMSLNNVQRIEVLRGPQGTLFGRNATGGLIQVVTKDPQQNFSGSARLGYGTHETYAGDLYVTGGLAADLAADLAVRVRHQGEGYGRNIGTNSEIGRLDRDYIVRSKFLWEPTEATSVRLSLDYRDVYDIRLTRDYAALPRALYRNVPSTPLYTVNIERNDTGSTDGGGAAATIRHDFGGVELVSISSWRDSRSKTEIERDRGPLTLDYTVARMEEEQLTQEFQVLSTREGSLDWVAGLFYFKGEHAYDPVHINFDGFLETAAGISTIEIFGNGETESIAGYAQGTLALTNATNLTLGLRYTYEKREAEGARNTVLPSGLRIDTPIAPDEVSFKEPTWRLSLDHQFTPDLMGYVSYNRGFKSGGFDMSAIGNGPYEPETIDAYELGLKSDLLERRLRLNAATYYYSYKNMQVSALGEGSAISTFNGAKAEVYGIDLDVELRVGEALRLTSSIAYVHDRFESFPRALFSQLDPALPGYLTQTRRDAAGNRLPSTPDLAANFGASYTLPVAGGDLTLAANYAHTSKLYFESDNQLSQPAYDLVNASLTWENDRFNLRLSGENLFDESYSYTLGTVPGRTVQQWVAPRRTVQVAVGVNF